MTTYLLAGGGTAGHVNPLLATADHLRSRDANSAIIVVGTAEGLESRLVPEAGYELVTIDKVPFPRSLSISALRFPRKFARAVTRIRQVIRDRDVDVVVGFGGYAAAPAYVAARLEGTPIVVHEANAVPGIANKLGSRLTRHVGVTFPGTPLPHATTVGMPLRASIATLDRASSRANAVTYFELNSTKPVVLVTGGSTGARHINATIGETASEILDAGWQIVHTVGESREFVDPNIAGYRVLPYCNRMDLAYAVADVVVARSGAATVSELAGLAIPTVFVPYPVGNGEQEKNAADIVAAGGAILCLDRDFTPEFVRTSLIPLLRDASARDAMAKAAQRTGIMNGDARLGALIGAALQTASE